MRDALVKPLDRQLELHCPCIAQRLRCAANDFDIEALRIDFDVVIAKLAKVQFRTNLIQRLNRDADGTLDDIAG